MLINIDKYGGFMSQVISTNGQCRQVSYYIITHITILDCKVDILKHFSSKKI